LYRGVLGLSCRHHLMGVCRPLAYRRTDTILLGGAGERDADRHPYRGYVSRSAYLELAIVLMVDGTCVALLTKLSPLHSMTPRMRQAPVLAFSFLHLRGLLIQWSVKVECWMEDSTLGMWQVVQFFVLTGQAAPG